VVQTRAALQQTEMAGYAVTGTAMAQKVLAVVTPRVFQTMPSPDGARLAQVILYDCTRIFPAAEELTYGYEVLKIDSVTVETQLVACGGMGAAGLQGRFWSPDSRYFYYTNAREGWPGGGYPWERPIARYDVAAGASEWLEVPVESPEGDRMAGAQSTDLVIWEIDGGAETRFRGPGEEGAWINWVAWSPDGRALAFTTQTNCTDTYPCPSYLTRVDLQAGTQALLLDVNDPPMLDVAWPQPALLRLLGADFHTMWNYDLASGALTPMPEPTLTPPGARPTATPVSPTATPAPTYPPDPAFPEDVYPPARPFLQPKTASRLWITGNGCPDGAGLQQGEPPDAKTLAPVLKAVRSGDVVAIRQNSDAAYWPATGLSLRLELWLNTWNLTIQPADQSPHAGSLTGLCGAQVLRASWWAQVNDNGFTTDYFLIRRGGRWLVWLDIYGEEQAP
jgi:hypothetical protein